MAGRKGAKAATAQGKKKTPQKKATNAKEKAAKNAKEAKNAQRRSTRKATPENEESKSDEESESDSVSQSQHDNDSQSSDHEEETSDDKTQEDNTPTLTNSDANKTPALDPSASLQEEALGNSDADETPARDPPASPKEDPKLKQAREFIGENCNEIDVDMNLGMAIFFTCLEQEVDRRDQTEKMYPLDAAVNHNFLKKPQVVSTLNSLMGDPCELNPEADPTLGNDIQWVGYRRDEVGINTTLFFITLY